LSETIQKLYPQAGRLLNNTKSVKQIIVHPFRKDKRERRKKKREKGSQKKKKKGNRNYKKDLKSF
jgi:hypothetical protein